MKKTFMGSILFLFSLTFILTFQNCSKKNKGGGTVVINNCVPGDPLCDPGTIPGPGGGSNVLSEVRFVTPDEDFTLQLIHSNLAYFFETDDADNNCFERAKLNSSQISDLLSQLNHLSYFVQDENANAPGGVAYVELKYKGSSSKFRLYLRNAPIGGKEIADDGDAQDLESYFYDLIDDESYVSSCDDSIDWDHVKAARYFRGGWYGPQGQPNWSHDYLVKFLSTGVRIEKKKTSGTCKRVSVDIPALQSLMTDMENHDVAVYDGPMMADAGVEIVTFYFDDGSSRSIHVNKYDISVGALYFKEPVTELSSDLKGLVDSSHAEVAGTCTGL